MRTLRPPAEYCYSLFQFKKGSRRMDAQRIIEQLNNHVAAGKSVDDILKESVRLIHASNPRYNWTGIYMLEGNTLVLHNFIGKHTDHTRIPVGTGVCGSAVSENRDINVPDVTALDNYLACSLETRSEIVVLIRNRESILGQIDIDSDVLNAFTVEDERFLGQIANEIGAIIGEKHSSPALSSSV
jgi:L-methionine (R)-S-oxide reductase